MNFLANLVKIFPNLKTRPLYLTGESYGGVYIVSKKARYPEWSSTQQYSHTSPNSTSVWKIRP